MNPAARLIPKHTVSQPDVQLSSARPVRVQRLPVHRDVPAHDHDYYEICLVTDGSAEHHTNEGSSPMRRGTVVVVPPGGVHAIRRIRRPFEVLNVYYLSEWLLVELSNLWDHDGLVRLFLAGSLFQVNRTPIAQFTLDEEPLELALRELRAIESERALARPSNVYLKSCLLKLMIGLARAQTSQCDKPAADLGFRREVWLGLERIEQLVREAEPLDLRAVASSFELSTDHFSRIFKQAVGRAPLDYYQLRRAQQACRLLLHPRHSVTDVAAAMGYSDSAHLSRMVRRYAGLSPREYRRRYLATGDLQINER